MYPVDRRPEMPDNITPEERKEFAGKAFGSNLRFWVVNEQAIRAFYDDDRNLTGNREAALQQAAELVATRREPVVIWERIAVLRPQVSVELQTADGETVTLERDEASVDGKLFSSRKFPGEDIVKALESAKDKTE